MSDRCRRLRADLLRVPFTAQVGDGWVDGVHNIGPEDPLFEQWAAYFDRVGDDPQPEGR